jgi:hypothetical protein
MGGVEKELGDRLKSTFHGGREQNQTSLVAFKLDGDIGLFSGHSTTAPPSK